MQVPHKVRGRGGTCVGPVDEMIVQQEHNFHQARTSIMEKRDQIEEDNRRLPYQRAWLRMCPMGQDKSN